MIYIIVAVIAFFIGSVIKVSIDEWLANLSMKRLSLKRNRSEHDTSEIVEISEDDESFDALPNARRHAGHKYTAETNNVSNSLTSACDSKSMHDSSNDDDVVIEEIPSTSKKNHAMFNWNKNLTSQVPQYQHISKGDNLFESGVAAMPMRSCNDDCDNMITLNDTEEGASPPQVTLNYSEMIAGIKVKFPVKPYLCQKAVMNKLIRGCTKEENCLIESPTGSGKTLALLCGALAWQEQYSEKILKENNAVDTENFCYGENNGEDNGEDNNACDNSPLNPEFFDKIFGKTTQRVPKIFYGTRTHKQIEQVVRELKKTAYKNKRMTILSSRKHTCIQETNRNKNELCNELLDPKKRNKCPYYNEENKRDMASFEALKYLGLETPWDIEDLVSLGKQIRACPYFAARSLMGDAEIIICPYNYIIDPNIRENMQISLKDHIVILDEAHNIENTCRDAASVNIKDVGLMNASKDCENLSGQNLWPNINTNIYITIHTYLRDLINFLKHVDVKADSNDKYGMAGKQWLGTEFREMLNIDKIGFSRFSTFLAASNAAIRDFNESRERIRLEKTSVPIITFETKTILEEFCFGMQMIMSETHVNDYRVCVIESEEYVANMKMREDVWISTRNKHQRVRILKLACMNPAVVFAPIARAVRSVILASGTLAPTSSFESELGTQFPHKLNANHIIPKEQVFVKCIPRGPGGGSLVANYEGVSSWAFKDELGDLILQVCDVVPYGVLCFFSSYPVMNSIHERWKNTGTWAKLAELKRIFVEPRESKDLEEIMTQYSDVIQKSLSRSFREKSGAIMFAVFRGKVAEGIDFRDNEARCVMTVGIPYMNLKDTIVSMKKKYNDSNMSKGLLSGSEWYTINAFRALNQALGRCIRHINDWGAVLMVDGRLQKSENVEKLPKWIKEMWRENTEDYTFQIELENFVTRQAARETGKAYVEEKGLKGYKV